MKAPARLTCIVLLLGVPVAASGAAADTQTQRLAAIGKLWFTVKYFHPYLPSSEIDWDKAFVNSYQAIVHAKTTEEYAEAADGLLAALGDPVSHVRRPQ